MSAVPSHDELASLGEEELIAYAQGWRARAARGDRSAYGVAHALEVELRRRMRHSALQQLEAKPPEPPRPWWKRWGASR
ncbi:MAG: hypothetical protein J7549_05820 [Variovorax sp.]|nr:hypothetical protein [Variovorax sp.]